MVGPSLKNGDTVWTSIGDFGQPKIVSGVASSVSEDDPLFLFTFKIGKSHRTKELNKRHAHWSEEAAIEARAAAFRSRAKALRLQADAIDRHAEGLEQKLKKEVSAETGGDHD